MKYNTYDILEADSREELKAKVNRHIRRGFTLIGGVSVVCTSPTLRSLKFYQAVAIEENEDLSKLIGLTINNPVIEVKEEIPSYHKSHFLISSRRISPELKILLDDNLNESTNH